MDIVSWFCIFRKINIEHKIFLDRFQIYMYILLLGNSMSNNLYNRVHRLTTTGAVKKKK